MNIKEQLEKRVQEYELQLREVSGASRKASEFESRMALLTQERERIEHVLKAKSQQCSEKDKIARELEFELENNKRKMTGLELRVK